MNKFGNLPVKILEKVPLDKPRWASNPVKVFVGVSGILLALSAMGVICLFSLGTHRHKTVGSSALIGAPVFPTTKITTPAGKGDGSATTFPGANQADNGTIAPEHSAIDQTPTPALSPIPSPAPLLKSELKAFASDSEFLKGERPEFEPKKQAQNLPKSVRKNLEKERREAERKRSRLEDLYQKHLISSEAYKKGEKEYKSEIVKYRSEVNAGGIPQNSLE
jgi:hypothetical protein